MTSTEQLVSHAGEEPEPKGEGLNVFPFVTVAALMALVAAALLSVRHPAHVVDDVTVTAPAPGTASVGAQPGATQRRWAAFVSPTYGYHVRYPSGWTVSPATRAWLPGRPRSHASDDVFHLAGAGTLRIAVLSLPAGSAPRWRAAYAVADSTSGRGGCDRSGESWTPVTIGGHRGRELGGQASCGPVEALAVIGHRVVTVLRTSGPARGSDRIDEHALQQLYGSLRLDRDWQVPTGWYVGQQLAAGP